MDDLLQRVERPSQYLGNERNAVRKDLAGVDLTVGLAYPDLYEIGMSNTGLHILYYMLNEAERVAAERVYLPQDDMAALLEAEGRRLATLENRVPLADLDVLGIQIPHELSYANIVKTLRLGGVTLWARDRGRAEPLVLGGGPGAFGAEPVAELYDAMLLGDAEDALWAVLDVYRAWRDDPAAPGRGVLLRRLAGVTGVYVPTLYAPRYDAEGRLAATEPLPGSGAPEVVHKAVVEDLEAAYYPDRAIVPFAETVHDRLGVEVMRGCTVGCRFCQAGMIYRPLRERSPQRILDLAKCGLGATGFESVSLLSLDTGDYTLIDPLTKALLEETAEKRVALSLPSLRAGSLTDEVIQEVARVRKTSFTIAPEAGSQRLRDVINKNISDEEIFETVERVARGGWKGLKLYFMIGFPSETFEDLDGMIDLVLECRRIAKRHVRSFGVTVSVGTLVPKPHTPFQWDRQLPPGEAAERIEYLRRRFKAERISFKYHQLEHSWLEGVFSRADRRLAPAIVEAEARGAGFESWSGRLDPDLWRDAFAAHGVDPDDSLRARGYDEALPWDHLSPRVTKKFLLGDRRKVDKLAEPHTFDCRDDLCAGCSCCFTDDIRNRLAKYHPDPFGDGRRLPVALTSRVAMGHGVAQQLERNARDQAAKAGASAEAAMLRRRRRPKKPSARRWHVTPGAPGAEGPAAAFLEATPPDEVPAVEEPAPAPAPADGEEAAPDGQRPPLYHYRVVYERTGSMRHLSAKEVWRVVYRALVRSALPLRYTQGYHPKPKVGFGPPLPTGCESRCEELDLYLLERLPAEDVLAALVAQFPVTQGLRPVEATDVTGRARSCHAERRAARYGVDLASLGLGPADGEAAVARFLAAERLPVEVRRPKKKARTADLKALLEDVRVAEGRLEFLLDQTGPSAKPAEVAATLLELPVEVARPGRYVLLGVARREPVAG